MLTEKEEVAMEALIALVYLGFLVSLGFAFFAGVLHTIISVGILLIFDHDQDARAAMKLVIIVMFVFTLGIGGLIYGLISFWPPQEAVGILLPPQ